MTQNNFSNDFDDLLAQPFALDQEEGELQTQAQKQDTSLFDRLSDKEKQQAQAMAKMIDEKNMSGLTAYGSKAQSKLNQFSHAMIDQVRNKDTGEIGVSLRQLMDRLNESELNKLQQNETNPIKRFFNRSKLSLYEANAKFQQVAVQVDQIADQLDRHQAQLLKDNQDLDGLYDENYEFFKVLNIYIAAAQLKYQELEEEVIPQKLQEAQAVDNQMVAQELADLRQFASRLEKRIYDLKLTRQVSIQQAPQIRLIQNTNQALAEKIQSSVHTAIPLWKNQMAIQLSLQRQSDALKAQQAVTDTTNQLLRQNADMLEQSSLEISRENERGIVDIETLEHVQKSLVHTIEETFQIQQEGRKKRQEAEGRLINMEDRLKESLLKDMERRQA
ncbi:toxic anion resistance protein [Aerococcus sanguinicola]|uniref:toxic anion resistance protein n=1 Tax=unclassified Aerococcus TaxID=2618060 RepID=UPI0008A54AFF|nr:MULTISPECIES: toxic anion resistance protein [unclassified Aerococcus]KAB0647761.1 toxic anion resistance protein [Aerococcus sanguinicola]MDK6232997.1 toxic anion resistance protein [Aerococcus sp. UMB10185]MDK6855291.1 toxic anion resistance protein [Aerococcus sp. UMB7533]OFN04783.1 tellurite resistance protein TelA [Aerococcus sp. HMSC062A02]OHO44675.1 tellurite resistance protein TelA [Aerococcus sp. HMSC035B07]